MAPTAGPLAYVTHGVMRAVSASGAFLPLQFVKKPPMTAVAASSDPAKPWSPILGAVLLGLVAAGFVAVLAAFLSPFRRQETVA